MTKEAKGSSTQGFPGFQRVLASKKLPGGKPNHPHLRAVRVGLHHLLLGRRADGTVVAFAPDCPHEGTSLTKATFEGRLIRCPTHLYSYDPVTGENVEPSRTEPQYLEALRPGYLRTHQVREEGGWIWVATEPNPPPHPAPEPEPEQGPAAVLTVTAGEEVELRLTVEDPRPGHIWVVEAMGPEVAVGGERMAEGDGSVEVVVVRGVSPGLVDLVCRYRQPWEEHAALTRRVQVEVLRPDPAAPTGAGSG